jgi:hypothetical protein
VTILTQVIIGILDLWNASTYLSIPPKILQKSSNSTYRPHMGVVYKRIPVGCVPSVHVFIMSLMGVFVMKFDKEYIICYLLPLIVFEKWTLTKNLTDPDADVTTIARLFFFDFLV